MNSRSSVAGQNSGTAFSRPRNFLGNRFVYAVISQRANGLSIGINLNPDQHCNFNCVYCEVKRDKSRRNRRANVRLMVAELKKLLTDVRKNKLRDLASFRNIPAELLDLKEVALSGDGEPTLCANFDKVVKAVIRLRGQLGPPFFKIVLITNGTGLARREVKQGLRQFSHTDEIWVKLDGGTDEYLKRVNRPDVPLRSIMASILHIGHERPIIIQSLFPLVAGQEPTDDEIEHYVHRLQELKAAGAMITKVQVYSAHRPAQEPDCGHLPLKSLSRIGRRIREATGLRAEVF